MGTVPSRESAERRQRTKESMDRRTAEVKETWTKIYAEQIKTAREKNVAEKQAATENLAADGAEMEEGEVLSQESAATAIPSIASSQRALDAGELLASFSPRKEPRGALAIPKPANQLGVSTRFENASGPQEPDSQPKNKLSMLGMTNAKPISTKPSNSTNTTKPTGVFNSNSQISGKLPFGGGALGKSRTFEKSTEPSEPARLSSAKRPVPPSAYGDERRRSFSNLPKIQKRTSVASPQSPARSEGQQLQSVGNTGPPKWYNDTPYPKSRAAGDTNADTLLQRLRDQIMQCKQTASTVSRIVSHDKSRIIREMLHKLFFNQVNASLLKRHRMLHDQSGLTQIFDTSHNGGIKFPWDICADAHELYNKWWRRIFDTDIFRGIKTGQTTAGKKDVSRNSDSIDRSYDGTVNFDYTGAGDLLNGQWWPTQLCALRDGAHGASQAGISGQPGDGAFSCIMSGGHDYPDEDRGDEVLYCGTDSETGQITTLTKLMLESVNNHPVRLIRSHNLESRFAPIKGFRYDGLYDVVGSERLDHKDSPRQRHRFHLVRQQGQDPIRGGSGPERRPTDQELEQYDKHMRLSGKKKGVE